MQKHLKKRGYKEKLILREINKAKQVPRDQALKPSVPKNKCNQGIPFVVTYNPASPNLNKTTTHEIIYDMQAEYSCVLLGGTIFLGNTSQRDKTTKHENIYNMQAE